MNQLKQLIGELVKEGILEVSEKDGEPSYKLTNQGKVHVENIMIRKLGINPSDFNEAVKKAGGKLKFV